MYLCVYVVNVIYYIINMRKRKRIISTSVHDNYKSGNVRMYKSMVIWTNLQIYITENMTNKVTKNISKYNHIYITYI